MEEYTIYQRIENQTKILIGKLIVNKVSEKPWIYLTVDFIIKLLLIARKNAILVVCDKLSKITYFMTTTEGMLAERLAQLFRDNMWKLHELPESMISDREP